MERIINYNELPSSRGETIYLKMETDPKLYLSLMSKGYKLIQSIKDRDSKTIYVTGLRQTYGSYSFEDYRDKVNQKIESSLEEKEIVKPKTVKFNYEDLINHQYTLPFVFKNENQNGGREKFLIETEKDYENLIKTCTQLMNKKIYRFNPIESSDKKYLINYKNYINDNFVIQEYINTPSDYNTTIRVLTSSSNDLLYAALKYKAQDRYKDDTTLLGHLLYDVYPLSTKSIVSNTLSGGKNILIGDTNYRIFEKELLEKHDINSEKFDRVVSASQDINEEFEPELGIICGFDYIYDQEKEKWYLLEYHSKPMLGDYSKRQGMSYITKEDRLEADGRIRATALSLKLKKTR